MKVCKEGYMILAAFAACLIFWAHILHWVFA